MLLLLSGCVAPRVIPSDRAIQRVKAGKPFTAPVDGQFIPDALWIDLNEELGRKINQ